MFALSFRKQVFAVTLTVMLLAIVGMACQPVAPVAPGAAPSQSAAPSPIAAEPTSQETNPEGGTLILATNLTADFPINPVIVQHRPGLWMFDPLLELDPKTGRPGPNLAESWTVSGDNKVYTFKLRQDVKWHDGVPFTADDVVFTFDAWLNDPSSIYKSEFTFGKNPDGTPRLAQARKVDDYTVEITLPEESASFLENLTGWHGIVPKHLLEGQEMAKAAFNEAPVGTGVLKFVELQPKQYVKYEMNKEYWRGRPHLDGFIWQVMPDFDAQVTALSNKEVDVIKNVVSDDMASKVEQIPGVTIYNVLGNYTWALFLNHSLEQFQDKRVREAIAAAIDKPTLVKGTVGKDILPADQLLNPSHWGFNPDARTIEYSPEQAKTLLEEAGWTDANGDGIVEKDGKPLAFTLITERVNDPTAAAIQDYLKAVGIQVEIKQVERAVRTELQKTGEWEAYSGWDGLAIPVGTYNINWKSDTWTNYSNADVDRLVAEADGATDANERATKIKEIEKLLTDDAAAIWLYYYNSAIAVSDNLAGLQDPPTTADQNNTGVFYHLEDLYMQDPN